LMLECEVKVEKAEGEWCLELSKGVDRFRACFDLGSGNCTLSRLGPDGKLQELGRQPTPVRASGEFRVRFANADQRLTVWVGGRCPCGDGGASDASRDPGPTANDREPASLGSKGAAVGGRRLKLWRDTYYGLRPATPDAEDPGRRIDWSDPSTWEPLRR